MTNGKICSRKQSLRKLEKTFDQFMNLITKKILLKMIFDYKKIRITSIF